MNSGCDDLMAGPMGTAPAYVDGYNATPTPTVSYVRGVAYVDGAAYGPLDVQELRDDARESVALADKIEIALNEPFPIVIVRLDRMLATKLSEFMSYSITVPRAIQHYADVHGIGSPHLRDWTGDDMNIVQSACNRGLYGF